MSQDHLSWRASIDEFAAEIRRTVVRGYIRGNYPRICWRRDRDDPLLEWRFQTCRLEMEPLPPQHPWNLPETIQPGGDHLYLDHAETATWLTSAGHLAP